MTPLKNSLQQLAMKEKTTTNDLFFRVAEAAFRIIFKDIEDGRPYLPSFAPFHIGNCREEELIFTLTIGEGEADSQTLGEEVGQFDCGGCNHGVYKIEDGYKMLVSNPQGKLCCAFTAQHCFSDCHATLFGNEEEQKFGLNNAVMIMFAFSGAMHNILLMHASVPMLEDKAYLCLGKSGTGKSTHCGLWLEHVEGADLLNDDNPAVRFLNGKTYIYGSPWSGKTPCYRNLRRECGGFLRLQQFPKNIIEKHTPLQGFASILSSCSTMIWDKPSYNAICDTVSKIASVSPSYHLRCKPDRDAARLSYNTMAR